MNEIKVKVTTLNDVDDFFNLLPTMGDLRQTLLKNYMKKHPMETAKALRDFGEIDELQYKEMITKIRKAYIEKDFKPIESSK